MDLNKIYSAQRLGYNSSNTVDPRSNFQIDYDRIIFSSAFRRLQNKTQVFPLPGSVFVHNRLTHSLEVASVGRSLGRLAGAYIAHRYAAGLTEESKEFYTYSLDAVIAAACLCHDIGNPAFGHSGEDAIASYFSRNEKELRSQFDNDAQWLDLINFEGNANAIRILTQQQNGKSGGSFNLTASTMAAIAKYPCESAGKQKGILHRKKFGFLQSEKELFEQVASKTSMIKENDAPVVYKRHPFVWLVEAADDICYTIIDLEDAHRLSIIEHTACVDILLFLMECIAPEKLEKTAAFVAAMPDKNEKVGYLRATAIGVLLNKAIEIYNRDFEQIVTGDYHTALFDSIAKDCKAIPDIVGFSVEHIYNHRSVVEIENAGYNVMYELLSHFIPPVLASPGSRSKAQDKAIKLIPQQFQYENGSHYEKALGVVDYVSGMTDNYATDLYKKIKGIEIGMTV
ncbi:MAG: dNTP triphosphohydrolase [Chitinophagaceae bacterium]|nr:MAG: dNTP triphosphohydrolase [Chitinophagaceae bacterium]